MAARDRVLPPGCALVECGFWLVIAYVGASGVAAGVLELADTEVRSMATLVLILGGGVAMAFGWWRSLAVLAASDDGAKGMSRVSALAADFAAAPPKASS